MGELKITVDGITYTVPDNATPEQIIQLISQQKQAQGTPPGPPGFLGAQGAPGQRAGVTLPRQHPDDAKSMISAALNGTGLLSTLAGPEIGIPMTTLTGALSGAMNGSLSNPEPGMGGAVSGGAENLILGLSGLMKGLIPKVANRGAYRLGGLGAEEAKAAAKNLDELNAGRGGPLHPFDRRIPAGAAGRTNRLTKDLGQDVQAAREADPNMHDFETTLRGFSDQPFEESLNTRLPQETGQGLRDVEHAAIQSHLERRGTPVDFGGSATRRGQPAQFGPARNQGTPGLTGGNILRPNVPTNRGPFLNTLEPQTTAQMRELETQLKHSNAAENLRKAQKSGDQVSAADYQSGRVDQAMASKIKQEMYDAESSPLSSSEAAGPMQQADKKYAVAKTAQDVNQKMRSPTTFGEAGKMAARAGLGSGVGFALGGPPGAAVGGLAGPFFLSPRGLSATGYAADDAIRALQSMGLSYKMAQDWVNANEQERVKAARRRKP